MFIRFLCGKDGNAMSLERTAIIERCEMLSTTFKATEPRPQTAEGNRCPRLCWHRQPLFLRDKC